MVNWRVDGLFKGQKGISELGKRWRQVDGRRKERLDTDGLVVNGAKRSGIGVEYALVNTWVDLDRCGFWMKYMKNY